VKGGREYIDELTTSFEQMFGAERNAIRLVRSPLRVCPLGAHVDHQLGLVTGMTINEPILLAYVPNAQGQVRLHSLNFSPPMTFSLDNVPPKGDPLWANYARGAVLALQQQHTLHCGIDGVIAGHMPIGGLSSSAAAGVAYLLALEDVNDLRVSPTENIELDRYIENVYIGLNNGILDQSVILLSEHCHLTFLDCQTIAFDRVPSPPGVDDFDVVIVYSGLTRSLVNTEYNRRVAQCEAAAEWLLHKAGLPVPSSPRLRLVPDQVFWENERSLPEPLDKRARHFFTELERVRQGLAAWREGGLTHFGALMAQSGESSITNYECGSPHLISLYEILNECPGVYGARFSGAGFRGCCIGLSDPAQRDAIAAAVHRTYPVRHPDVKGEYGIYFRKPDGRAQRIEY
jgi:galactokinase/galacturonokinase